MPSQQEMFPSPDPESTFDADAFAERMRQTADRRGERPDPGYRSVHAEIGGGINGLVTVEPVAPAAVGHVDYAPAIPGDTKLTDQERADGARHLRQIRQDNRLETDRSRRVREAIDSYDADVARIRAQRAMQARPIREG
jgi:hypothetical protein